jgi:ABC-2 type transport system permease protein
MRRIPSLTITLLRDWIRNREAVFFALLFPLLLLIIFSLVFAGGATEFDIGVQNHDLNTRGEPTESSATLITAMEETPPLEPNRIDSETDLAETENVEEVTGYKRVLVIPEGFDERVRASSARVRMAVIQDTVDQLRDNISSDQQQDIEAALDRFETDQDNGTSSEQVQLILITVPDDEGAGAVESILDSVVATFSDRSIGVEEPTTGVRVEERGQQDLGATDYFLPAFIVAMILINGVMTVPSAVAQFKRDGTLKRLAVSPLRKHEWIIANVIQQSVLAVAIALALIAVAWLVFGVTAIPGPLAIALIVLGTIGFSSLGMIVGSLIRTPGSAISLGGAIALPLMFVSGIFWELDLMPPTLQTVAEFSPVTHFHRSLRELMILDSTSGVAFTFVFLSVLTVVFFVGAITLTSWQEFE